MDSSSILTTSINIGKFTLFFDNRLPNEFFISIFDGYIGEGGYFDIKDFEEVIRKFYEENF